MQISGKVAIVTGGAQGIGRAIVEAILEKGGKVTIVDVNSSVGETTAEELRGKHGESDVMFVKCDVTDNDQFDNVFIQTKIHFGRVDIVVNNAGIFDENDVKKCTSVNLNSVICGTMLGVEHMRKNKEGGEGGVVVNMASTAGLQPYPLIPVYTATKHGIVGYTRCWGANPDFPYQLVRVNCLCPHLTNTSLLQLTPEQKAAGVVRHVRLWEAWYPMAMMTALSPSTVAEACIQLIEDDTRNGAVLKVAAEGTTYQSFQDESELKFEIPEGFFVPDSEYEKIQGTSDGSNVTTKP